MKDLSFFDITFELAKNSSFFMKHAVNFVIISVYSIMQQMVKQILFELSDM